MSNSESKIKFLPREEEEEFATGISLLEAADKLEVGIINLCGGEGKCGKCKVIVRSGGDNLSDLSDSEKSLLTRDEIESNYRLACQARLGGGEVEVEVPKGSRKRKQLILTEGRSVEFEKNPPVKRYPLEVDPPTLEDASADFESVTRELENTYDLEIDDIDYYTQKELPNLLREVGGEEKVWNVSSVVRNEGEIIDLGPKTETGTYGLAVDLGTSTVVGYLMDLSSGEVAAVDSIENPQVKFGEDLMTRFTTIL
ncbi:MAG: 2Fe-2S iron-sulfur cluster-binding protein [Candidatus Aenigmatarchaeota archaeon]